MNASSLACCLVALCTAACGGAADIPDTPDLRELLANYQAPTASLNQTSAAEALKSAPSLSDLEALAVGFQAAESLVASDVDQASSTSSGSSGTRIRLQGSINLHVRCPGDPSNPNYDESVNGSVSLTLAVADNRIRRSFGGEAKTCRLLGKLHELDASVELDGPLAFDLGGDVGIGQRWTGTLLASLPGALTVAGHEFRTISGRLVEGRFQHLVTLPDGKTIVLQVSGDGGITIRDNTGVWFCKEGEPCAVRN